MRTGIRQIAAAALVAAAVTAGAVEWQNAEPDARLGGRMISAGYLKGKVVMVDRRDYGQKANLEAMKRLQALWIAYKSKPFVLVGSHTGTASDRRIAAVMEKFDLTYPIYRDFGGEGVGEEISVFDETGKRHYAGGDDKAAQAVVGQLLLSMAAPQTEQEWAHYLDWEVKHTPGNAYLRLKEFAKSFPAAAKERYGDDMNRLAASDDVKKLAKLVEIARLMKDRDMASAGAQKLTKARVDEQIRKFAALKASDDPAVVQEAKNALAELAGVKATLTK
jgi:hypothetical protein